MAALPCVTDQFMLDVLSGRNMSGDIFMVALYDSGSAVLGPTTAVYSATGEVSSSGYVAGGLALTGRVTGLTGDIAYLTWDPATWFAVTFTTDCCLIYNATNANHTVCVMTFDVATLAGGDLVLNLPVAGSTATVTIGNDLDNDGE